MIPIEPHNHPMTKDIHRITPYPLRLFPDFRKKLEDVAKANGRSLNAEIVARLEWSFSKEIPTDEKEIASLHRRVIKQVLAEELDLIKELRSDNDGDTSSPKA